MADQERYPRAPIVQAIIDLRFDEALDPREMIRARDRFKRDFPTIEEIKTVQFEIQPKESQVKQTVTPAGFKMIAKNAVDLLLINLSSVGTVRLAPYESWDALIQNAKENFEVFTKVLGRKKVIRIGARYINRFDIPDEQIMGKELTEFLRLGISLPDEISKKTGPYSLAINAIEVGTGTKLLLQSAIQTPALLDHTSISLDVDAFFEQEIPQRIEEMWEKAAVLRRAKNSVFENSITDKLRELFR
jgi:uncharacterized protein (TIGR04255 family)